MKNTQSQTGFFRAQLRRALNLYCDFSRGAGTAGRISQAELGGLHVAYQWTEELIKTEFQPQSIALHAF